MSITINGREFILLQTDLFDESALIQLNIPEEQNPYYLTKKIYASRKGNYIRLRISKNQHKRIYLEEFENAQTND